MSIPATARPKLYTVFHRSITGTVGCNSNCRPKHVYALFLFLFSVVVRSFTSRKVSVQAVLRLVKPEL
jgi:hypothetical protein